jgi:hypothetical protein
MSATAASTTPACATLASSETAPHGGVGWIRFIGLRLRTWVDAYAATSAAAVLYRELSRLSDAELERRGTPRGELHRCVFEALDGPPAMGGVPGDP